MDIMLRFLDEKMHYFRNFCFVGIEMKTVSVFYQNLIPEICGQDVQIYIFSHPAFFGFAF